MEKSGFTFNCTDLQLKDFKDLNLMKTISASFCIASIIIIAIIAFTMYIRHQEHKKEGLTNELYFILLAGTFITEIVQVIDLEHQFQYSTQEKACKALAFFDNWASIMSLFYSLGLISYLFYLLIFNLFKETCSDCLAKPFSCCRKGIQILAYILLPIFFSLLFALIPFINGNYGLAGPWCWIRSIDANCNGVGLVDQVIYFTLYGSAGVAGLMATVVYLAGFLYLWHCKKGRFTSKIKDMKTLAIRTLSLMPFHLLYVVVVCLQLSVRIITAVKGRHHDKVIWGFHAFFIPIGYLIFPLGFLITFYPRRHCCTPEYKVIPGVSSPSMSKYDVHSKESSSTVVIPRAHVNVNTSTDTNISDPTKSEPESNSVDPMPQHQSPEP